jgi:hypothetical protein
MWIVDAHRDDGNRFIVRADEKLKKSPEFVDVLKLRQRILDTATPI